MTAKKITISAVMTALLIAVQLVLSFVPGVELATVLLLCFCYTFGVLCGMITATAFSLLRCLLFGFAPNIIILYLVYYNIFAVIFGFAGKKKSTPRWLCPVLLGLLAFACAFFAVRGIKISILYETKIKVMLWILFAISLALTAAYFVMVFCFKNKGGGELAAVTSLGAFCTVIFTLLDDVITPLFYGYSAPVAIAYFYNGFIAMLPQTICSFISILLLFYPLTRFFAKVAERQK